MAWRQRHFDPDQYLETDAGRVFTPERSAAAFERAYAELADALQAAPPGATLHVVVGVQGSGKSHWVRANADRLGAGAYFFDAALPRAQHRERVVSIAKHAGVRVCAVWVRASLDIALARNQARRADHRVPEEAVRSVHAMMQAPSVAEGFDEVIEWWAEPVAG